MIVRSKVHVIAFAAAIGLLLGVLLLAATGQAVAKTSEFTVTSSPAGPDFVTVDGTPVETPYTVSWDSVDSYTLAANSPVAGVTGVQYVFSHWSDGGDQSHLYAVPVTGETITAFYTQQFLVSFTASPSEGGSVTPSGADLWEDAGSLQVQAAPSVGYVFSSWSSDTGSITFVDPTASTTNANINGPGIITANFVPAADITITSSPAGLNSVVKVDGTLYSTPQTFTWPVGSDHGLEAMSTVTIKDGERYIYGSWSDGKAQTHSYVVPSIAETVTASYAHQYWVDFANDPSGAGTTTPSVATWQGAGPLSVEATPSEGYSFSSWSSDSISITFGDGSASSTTATINGPGTITAHFSLIPVGITITSDPAGSGYVTVAGGPVESSQTFEWAPGSTHTITATSPKSIGSGAQLVFSSWSDGGAQSHTYTTPGSSATVTASYTLQYQVSFVVLPVSGAATTSPSGTVWANAGTLAVQAAPQGAYNFQEWSSSTTSITIADKLALSTSVSIDGPGTITANLVLVVGITITTNAAGATVTVDDVVWLIPHTFSWSSGTSHTLVSPAVIAVGSYGQWVFNSWSDGGLRSHTFTVTDAVQTVTANYDHQYLLTMSVDAGSTTTPAAGVHWYNAGDTVTINSISPTAVTGEKYVWLGWAGTGSGSYSGLIDPPSVDITMNGPVNESAQWQHQYLVTMATNVGSVSPVTGTWHNAGEVITLTATAPSMVTGERYTSNGWTGTYTGTINPATNAVVLSGPLTESCSWTHQFRLVMATNQGTTTPSVGTNWFNEHTVVDISTATPSPITGERFSFNGWTSTGTDSYTGTTMSFSVTMDGPLNETASWTHQFQLTMGTNMGTVTPVAGSAWYDAGTHVIIQATAPTTAGVTYHFSGWTGTGTGSYTGTGNPVTVIVNAPMTETATWLVQSLPGRPTGLTAVPGDAMVTLNWTAPISDGGAAIDHYSIFVDGVQVTTSTGLTAVLPGLTNDRQYSFTVSAHNAIGDGPSSAGTLATPHARIADLSVTITSPANGSFNRTGNVVLRWTIVLGPAVISSIETSADGSTWRSVTGTSSTLTGLSDGRHTLYVRVTDVSENTNMTSVTIIVDSTQPTSSFNSPISGTYLTDHSVLVSWTVSDTGSGLATTEVSADGKNWTKVVGTSTRLTLADGSRTISLRTTDKAGNLRTNSVTVMVDTTAPTLISMTPTGTTALTRSSVNITFSEAMNTTGSSIVVKGVYGSTIWNGSNAVFMPAVALTGKTSYEITVTGKDLAGNTMTQSWNFTTANVAKIYGIVHGHGGQILANALVRLIGPATAGQTAMAQVTMAIASTGGHLLATTTTDSDGQYVFYDVAVGSYTLEITETGFGVQTRSVTMTADAVAIGGLSSDQTIIVGSQSDDTVMFVAIVILAIAIVVLVLIVRRRKVQAPPKKPAVVEKPVKNKKKGSKKKR